jgi:type II restriction enzyme
MPRKTLDVRKERVRLSLPKANQTRLVSISRVVVFRPYLPIYTVTGVEVGLDSNGRKNRGGHLMENLVEDYLVKTGLVKGETYFKEMKLSAIESKWHIDLSGISNQGKAEKRFDFVVKKGKTIFAIETNFYTGGGSKLNETARSYKTIALEAKQIDGFAFVWFTDGYDGWKSARHNLEETFDVLENMYCIADLENGIIERLFD